MAWQYADYFIENDPFVKHQKLSLHVLEVTQTIAGVQAQAIDKMSYQKFPIIEYLKIIRAELKTLERALGIGDAKRDVVFARARVTDTYVAPNVSYPYTYFY